MATKSRPVGIIGMGYVGTSLAAVIADAGYEVLGIDIERDRVDEINQGACPIDEEMISELFGRYVDSGHITASTDFGRLESCESILVTVGTPLSTSDPDLSAVKRASEDLGSYLREGHAVIYRSTLPAKTTETVVRPLLEERSGLAAGEGLSLAFCPERMAEGSAYQDLTTTPVVVGGVTASCQKRAERFWEELGFDTVSVSSPTAAELTKLADNWWIDLNIALANEIALLSEPLGVDALEVIHAANTLPKGEHNVNILFPGAGVGGSCLVKDPWFVANLGEQYNLDLQTPRVSRRVNDQMPGHMVELLSQEFATLNDVSVAVLGYTFKAGTDDTRNTPAKQIVRELLDRGAAVRVTDPLVESSVVYDEVDIEPRRLPSALENVDAVMVVTAHNQYHELSEADVIDLVGTDEFVVVDGRHVFDQDAFRNENVEYLGVGRGRRE